MTATEFNSGDHYRSPWRAMLRGALFSCPACGKGTLYAKYLKSAKSCNSCGEELHHHRADDAPPYFTMLLIGHIVFPGIFIVERLYTPPVWVQFAIWIPALTILSLGLLPVVKGSIIGLQWALRMHGFGEDPPNNKDGTNVGD